jgi:predicted house-cleaning NTP pyrophosphatase (Maf/HAM1 superfamily)
MKDNVLYGKASNEDEAIQMVRTFSGTSHQVVAAYSIARFNKNGELQILGGYDITDIIVDDIPSEDIRRIAQEGRKACGCFTIEGAAAKYIKSISGTAPSEEEQKYSVYGVPIHRIRQTLRQMAH